MTLLNLSEFDAGDSFKLIYSVGEAVAGDVLKIGNPNYRVKLSRPLHEFFDAWCQQGPAHHIALGIGDRSQELETLAEAMRFNVVRV